MHKKGQKHRRQVEPNAPALTGYWEIGTWMLNDRKLAASGSFGRTSSPQPPEQGDQHGKIWCRAINNLSKSEQMQHNWAHYITHRGERRGKRRGGWREERTRIGRITEGWRQTELALLHRWACGVQSNGTKWFSPACFPLFSFIWSFGTVQRWSLKHPALSVTDFKMNWQADNMLNTACATSHV